MRQSSTPLPLSGVKVVELGQLIAGPFAAKMLAEFGAEVIKVAVIGRNEIMDLYPPGSMTSTHTGNPVCAAAALANLKVIEEENLVENSRRMGEIMQPLLREVGARFPRHVGVVHGKGLVAALHMVKPGGIEPDSKLAADIVRRCVEKGLLMFAPVGYAGASVKIAPPLVTPEDAIREGVAVLEEAMREAIQ